MPVPVKQSHSQGQHDRLLVGVARGGGRALLGMYGVGLRTGVVAGGHLKLWGACLLIPATSWTLKSKAQMHWSRTKHLTITCCCVAQRVFF